MTPFWLMREINHFLNSKLYFFLRNKAHGLPEQIILNPVPKSISPLENRNFPSSFLFQCMQQKQVTDSWGEYDGQVPTARF